MRRGLAAVGKISLGEPVAKSGRLERVELVATADFDAGMKAAVGRAKELRLGGEPPEDFECCLGRRRRSSPAMSSHAGWIMVFQAPGSR